MSDETIYTVGDVRSIMTRIAEDFMGLRDGSNSIVQFNRLAAAMNIGIVRSESISEAAVEVFRAAQQALLEADRTFDALRAYTFNATGLIDIAKAVQGYSELLAMSTPQQMEAARVTCEKRLAAGLHATLHAGPVH